MADYYNGELQNESGGGSSGGTTTVTGITETEARALIANWAEQGHARPSVGFLVSVERTMAIQTDRDTPSEVSLAATSGTNNYVLRIDENPDSSEQLSAGFLTDMEIGAEVEIRQGSTARWHGSVTALTDISGEANARSLRINFPTQTGTFTTGQAVIVRFGYISDPQIYRNVLYLEVNDPLPDISSLEEFHRHDNTIIIRGRNTYQSLHRHIPATDASGTWSAFTSSDDANFVGPRTTDPATASANQYYYNYLTHHWRQTTFLQNAYHWQNAGDSVIDGNSDAVFIGEFSRRVDATNSVSTVGQDPNDTYFAYFLGQIQELDSSTFVEHVDGSNIFEWIKVGVDTTGTGIFDLGPFDVNYNYQKSEVCETTTGFYISLVDDNLGNTPADSPEAWESWGDRLSGMALWYTRNQTERFPTEPADLDADNQVTTNGVIGFSGDDPNESYLADVGVTFTNLTDESDADITDDRDFSVFNFPAGWRGHIAGNFYGSQPPNAKTHIRLIEITSGTDDIIYIAGTPRQQNYLSDTSPYDAHYEIDKRYVYFAAATKLYCRLVEWTTGEAGNDYLIGYILFERIT